MLTLQGMHPQGTGEKDENVMPAKSVAKLAYHLLKDYPEVLETTKIQKRYSVKAQMMQSKWTTGTSCFQALFMNMKV